MTRDEAWLLNDTYGGEKTDAFYADCKRLAAGEPLAYIIGHVPFLDATIFLDSRPLIPRPETEFWVSETIKDIAASGRSGASLSILDLCAGSGCIGIALLMALPRAHVDFAEIDASHHGTIRTNAAKNGVREDRYGIVGGDLFEHVSGCYDFIYANPPYVDASLERTEKSVLEYEPATALFGGKDGFEVLAHIIEEAPQHLTGGGVLYIEHEPEQAVLIADAVRQNGCTCQSFPDQFGTTRFTRIARQIEK